MNLSFDGLAALESQEFTTYKHIYVDISDGEIAAGILLSRIVYWFGISQKTKKIRTVAKHNGRSCLIKSRKDWWDECRISERVYDRCIKILKDKGYITCEIHKSPFHKQETAVYIFIEKEALMNAINLNLFEQESKEECEEGENPGLPNGDSGITKPLFQDHQTVIPSYIAKTIDKDYIHKEASPPIEMLSFGSHVKIKKSEHEELVKLYGDAAIIETIEAVNDYCAAHGKTYKSYAAAIRTFIKSRKNPVASATSPASSSPKLSEDQQLANKNLANEFKIFHWKNLDIRREVDIDVEFVKIKNDKILYKDHRFKELFEHNIRKHFNLGLQAKDTQN